MTFCRINPIQTTYSLRSRSLDRIKWVDDLGVLLEPKYKYKYKYKSLKTFHTINFGGLPYQLLFTKTVFMGPRIGVYDESNY